VGYYGMPTVSTEYQGIDPEEYLRLARSFIPDYDILAQKVAFRVIEERPKRILSIGSGVGNIEERILLSNPNAHITCVEPSVDFARYTHDRLSPYKDRAEIIQTSFEEFDSNDVEYDTCFTNLALHNVKDTPGTLQRIHGMLKPNALFVWSDLVTYQNKEKYLATIGYRHIRALLHGAPSSFVIENFYKEMVDDHKLTVEQMVEQCLSFGFTDIDPKKEYKHWQDLVEWESLRSTVAMLTMRQSEG
jgi:trans-aconitate methyltransferase